MGKRIISALLVLTMLLTAFPVTALAAEKPQVRTENDDVSLEGTNDFGNLLTKDLKEDEEEKEEAAESYSGGYSISELEIEGNTAYVTYEAAEEATLVVGVYTEDGLQLLTSGKVTVSPDETAAEVTIEGEMPEYFRAEAYMVDNYDFSPLCASYHTPMYTKEMQELLKSTIYDYAPERVLNLDQSPNTNFAVFAEDTKIIEEQAGVNTVKSVNDDTNTYVIENADEAITSLKKGDILAYPYGDNEMIIAKVGSIKVDGDTVTITGDELEMEDAFDTVKIETEASTEDFIVDESIMDEGVTYLGMSTRGEEASAYSRRSAKTSTRLSTFTKSFCYDITVGSVSASIDMDVTASIDFYITFSKKFVEFKAGYGADLGISVSDSLSLLTIELGALVAPVLPGVTIGFRPEFVVEVEGEITVNLRVEKEFCVQTDGKDITAQNPFPKVTPKSIEFDVSIKVGLNLNPTIDAVGGALLSLSIDITFSLIFDVNMSYNHNSDHLCKSCLSISLSFEFEIAPKLTILKMIELSKTLYKYPKPLCEGYYSPDFGTFSLISPCPHKASNDGSDEDTGGNSGIGTGGNGGYEGEGGSIFDTYEPDNSVDYGHIVASGECGEQGDNLLWTLHSDGTLRIMGKGDMADYEGASSSAPWKNYQYRIKQVIIEENVTSIGDLAFDLCHNITSIEIPDGLTRIGFLAFEGCINLKTIEIPNSVTSIEPGAFYYSGLTTIEIPNSVTSIKSKTFFGAYNLTSIEIPDSVTSIEVSAFESCSSLTSIEIPDSVTSIGVGAFCGCSSLISIEIPDSVTSIEVATFIRCVSLESIEIPDSVTNIADRAFSGCASLTDVCYTGTEEQWKEITIEDHNEHLTSATIHYNYSPTSATPRTLSIMKREAPVMATAAKTRAIHGGKYETEIKNEYTLKTASFTGLVPGEAYVMLALVSTEIEDILAADNLLNIMQGVADEDGNLTFKYVQRVPYDRSYVVACGPDKNGLENAVITFPEMRENGEVQTVQPVVVLDGVTLVKDKDYVITGDVEFTVCGEYTCTIVGIGDYTGSVECTYTCIPRGDIDGDINGDNDLTNGDVIILARFLVNLVELTEEQKSIADMNSDGQLRNSDLVIMVRRIVEA